jgi:hypothetical protein
LAIDVITGTSNHAQSPVSLATTRKFTTTTTSNLPNEQPTKRLRNDHESEQPQNHSNAPKRSITIDPTHTNTSSSVNHKKKLTFRPPPPSPQTTAEGDQCACPSEAKGAPHCFPDKRAM